MRHAGLTDTGLVRRHNEDAWGVAELSSGRILAVVSDGVGGGSAGEVASELVIKTLPEILEEHLTQDMDQAAIESVLEQSLQELNQHVFLRSGNRPGLNGMAATVVCGLFTGNSVCIGHMGDSRAYLLRKDLLILLTRDHTVVQVLLDMNEITYDQARDHPAHGRLTQAVGMEQKPLPDVTTLELEPGDKLLLSSDGLHGMVEDEAIHGLLTNADDPEKACQDLVAAALEAGGRDNVTVVVVRAE